MAEANKKSVSSPAVEAQRNYDLANKVWRESANAHYGLRKPSDEWVQAFRSLLQTRKQNWDKEQQADLAYEREVNPNYQVKPFVIADHLQDALEAFAQKIEYTLDISADVRHAEKEYFKYRPQTEMSDELNKMQAEAELGSIVERQGLGSLAGMGKVLYAISNFAHVLNHASPNETGMAEYQEGTEAVITKGIPFILYICKLLGAQKTQ